MKRNLIINELQKKIERDTKIYELAKIVPYSVKEVKNQLSKFNYSEIEVLYKIVCMGYDYDKFKEVISKKEIDLKRLVAAARGGIYLKRASTIMENLGLTVSEAVKRLSDQISELETKEKDDED